MSKRGRVYAKVLIVVLAYVALAFGAQELVLFLDEPYHIGIAGGVALALVIAANVLVNLLYDYWEKGND